VTNANIHLALDSVALPQYLGAQCSNRCFLHSPAFQCTGTDNTGYMATGYKVSSVIRALVSDSNEWHSKMKSNRI